MMIYGIPDYIRLGNEPVFITKKLGSWLSRIGVKKANIELGSAWENGLCESINVSLRDSLLDGEIFYSLREAIIIVRERIKQMT